MKVGEFVTRCDRVDEWIYEVVTSKVPGKPGPQKIEKQIIAEVCYLKNLGLTLPPWRIG